MSQFITTAKLNAYSNEFNELVDDAIIVKEAFVKKMPNGKFRVLSRKGKNLGEYDTKEEAKKRLSQIEYFKHKKASNKEKFEDTTSYSAVMRDLNKYYNKDEIEKFQKTYKELFDNALLNGDSEPEASVLEEALQCVSEENVSIKKLADEVSLGNPESVGNYLAHIVRFLLRKISEEKRPGSIKNIKKKIFYLNEYELGSKSMPPGSSIGQSIVLIKHLMFGKDPSYIRSVLNSIIKYL